MFWIIFKCFFVEFYVTKQCLLISAFPAFIFDTGTTVSPLPPCCWSRCRLQRHPKRGSNWCCKSLVFYSTHIALHAAHSKNDLQERSSTRCLVGLMNWVFISAAPVPVSSCQKLIALLLEDQQEPLCLSHRCAYSPWCHSCPIGLIASDSSSLCVLGFLQASIQRGGGKAFE